MEAKRMSSDAVRSGWQDVVDNVVAGGTVLVERHSKPVAVMIPYADFLVIREQLEDLHDLRLAEDAYKEHLQDPSGARSLSELRAEWAEKDAAEDAEQASARQ